MNRYSNTYGKKLINVMAEGFEYLTAEIEMKERLIPTIQSHLHSHAERELKGIVPREIVDKYVNLIFLTFHA